MITEPLQILQGQLLHLMRRVTRLEMRTQPVPLDRLGQDHRGLALELDRGLIRGIHLMVIMPATLQIPDLIIRQMSDHILGLRTLTKEMLPHKRPGLGLIRLVIPIRGLVHHLNQGIILIPIQQRIPLPTPHDLDHVPPRTPEERLQLLHDLPITPHRPIQPLQVAVHHKRQVIQPLIRGQLQEPPRLGLIHLPITQKRPHLLITGVLDPPMQQVPVQLRLVNRVRRTQPHRHRRELPELRHTARVRVGRQRMTGLGLLLPEPVHILLRQPPLKERARVHPRRRVPLEEDLIPTPGMILPTEEMIEPNLIQGRGPGIRGNMAPHPNIRMLTTMHHNRRVPPHKRPIPALDLLITREHRLLIHRDRVHIIRRGHHRHPHGLRPGPLQQRPDNELGPLGPLRLNQRIKRIQPFLGLFRIPIRQLIRQTTTDRGDLLVGCR